MVRTFMWYISFDSQTNTFWDANGQRIENNFTILTPNDIFLFRQDPGYCIFPHRKLKSVTCEIFTEE